MSISGGIYLSMSCIQMSEAFQETWQNLPYLLNPVFLEFGCFSLGYYGLMYIIAFFITYHLCIFRIHRERFPVTVPDFDKYLTWLVIGILTGARIGYYVLYNPARLVGNPLGVFIPFEFGEEIIFIGFRGMSFHGGLVGGILASFLFSVKYRVSVLLMGDLLVPVIPLGYMFGRIGNFFNGELYGRAAKVCWAMYFPGDQKHILRHPSQLYEAFGEGLFLFIILWNIRNRESLKNHFLFLYVLSYGIIRFVLEYFREPDEYLGLILNTFTYGQLYCILMTVIGTLLLFLVHIRKDLFNQ